MHSVSDRFEPIAIACRSSSANACSSKDIGIRGKIIATNLHHVNVLHDLKTGITAGLFFWSDAI
jgi:hypothetical protein